MEAKIRSKKLLFGILIQFLLELPFHIYNIYRFFVPIDWEANGAIDKTALIVDILAIIAIIAAFFYYFISFIRNFKFCRKNKNYKLMLLNAFMMTIPISFHLFLSFLAASTAYIL